MSNHRNLDDNEESISTKFSRRQLIDDFLPGWTAHSWRLDMPGNSLRIHVSKENTGYDRCFCFEIPLVYIAGIIECGEEVYERHVQKLYEV